MGEKRFIRKYSILALSVFLTMMSMVLTTKIVQADTGYDYTVSSTIDKTGKTDVSGEINSILSSAARTGTASKPAVVYIPDGTYYIGDTSLVIGSNTILHLSNNAVIKYSNNGSCDAIMLISSNSHVSGYGGMNNVEIYGGVWDGNQSSSKSTLSNGSLINMLGVAFSHSQNIYIHDTTVKNLRGEHAFIFDGCKNVSIKNVVFQDIYPYTGISGTDNMEALHFDITNAAGSIATPLDDTPCVDITVTGCTFLNVNAGVGTHHDEANLKTVNRNFTISNNTFKNVKGNAINAALIDGAVISNNSSTSCAGDFLQVYGSKNLTVESNNADGANYGIFMAYGNHGLNNIFINNNTIKNTRCFGISIHADDAQLNSIAENAVTMTGNIVNNATGYGIFCNGFKANIEGNSVDTVNFAEGLGVERSNITGIKVRYTTEGSLISGNNVSNVNRGIDAVYSDNVTISNNTVTDFSSEGIKTLGSGNVLESNTIQRGNISIWLQYRPGKGVKDVVKNNTISDSSKEGIWAFADAADKDAASSVSVEIEGNSVKNSRDFGICVQNYGSVNVSRNRVSSVSLSEGSTMSNQNVSGIKVEKASAGASISGNEISNTIAGVWTTACDNVNILSNVIKDSSGNGIKLTSLCSGVTISDNSLVGCSNNSSDDESVYAILSIETKGLSITDNAIYSNGKTDITVWGPSSDERTVIKGNKTNGNADERIYCNSSNKEVDGNSTVAVYSISGTNTDLSVGDKCLLVYSSNDVVTWVSSDSSIASVDQNGCVKAIKNGQCVVSVIINGQTVASQSITVSGDAIVEPNDGSGDNSNSGSGDSSSGDSGSVDNSSSGSSDSSGGDSGSTSSGYSSEWINGRWYNANGVQDYDGVLQWYSNSTGWWVEDTSGWYPVSSWQKIDGYWYYFDENGYMASNEWRGGYWLGSSGALTYDGTLSWKCNSTGWWVEDSSGWYPYSMWQKIDGYWYYFGSDGYMVTSKYIDGYWIGADGVCR